MYRASGADHMTASPYRTFWIYFRFTLCVLPLFTCGVVSAQRKPAAADPDKLKIRAITAFVNLDRSQYQPQIADAVKMLKYARTVFESRGFEVQTIRISTRSEERRVGKECRSRW